MSQDCLPELTPDQFALLREDIRLRGVQTPVEICANSNEILDGRARVRACKELKVSTYPRRVVGGLDSEEARRHHRLKANCLRRQLDRSALQGIGPRGDAAEGAERQAAGGDIRRRPFDDRRMETRVPLYWTTPSGQRVPGSEWEDLSPPTSIFATTTNSANKAARLLNELGRIPLGQAPHLACGERTRPPEAAGAGRRQGGLPPVRGQALRRALPGGREEDQGRQRGLHLSPTRRTIQGMGRSGASGRTSARLAERVLKPEGLLFTYAGVAYLDRVMRDLSSAGLDYIWTVAVPRLGLLFAAVEQERHQQVEADPGLREGVRRLPAAVFDFWEGTIRAWARAGTSGSSPRKSANITSPICSRRGRGSSIVAAGVGRPWSSPGGSECTPSGSTRTPARSPSRGSGSGKSRRSGRLLPR